MKDSITLVESFSKDVKLVNSQFRLMQGTVKKQGERMEEDIYNLQEKFTKF